MSRDLCLISESGDVLYASSITNYVDDVAEEAGLHVYLWYPHDVGFRQAHQIVDEIKDGLNYLTKRPDFFKKFDIPNKWSVEIDFIPFLENYYNALREYPDAHIFVSRSPERNQ